MDQPQLSIKLVKSSPGLIHSNTMRTLLLEIDAFLYGYQFISHGR